MHKTTTLSTVVRHSVPSAEQLQHALKNIQKLEHENFCLREALDMRSEELIQAKEQVKQFVYKDIPLENILRLWKLTGKEARLLACLLEKDVCTKQSVLDKIYWDKNYPPQEQVLNVFLSKIRKKISPFGMEIETIFGFGWALKNRQQWLVKLKKLGTTK